jgi:hypothetical protein
MERHLAKRMGEWLNREIEAVIVGGQPTSTSASVTTDQTLNVDDLLRLVGRLRAEQRWLAGRPVRAMKIGQRELRYIRGVCQPASGSLLGTIAPLGDSCWGVPCYEVDRHSYFEPIYEDEASTREVLNERLMREPRAIWGKVEAG